ncbi:MAG: TetR family transcriptional regulator [Salinibacterium sp.]|nr:TetR family transcriptional regulator [Salinibacterium sp.]MBF0673542.1 TetR family transcriptional regulator [Salinibacterium sp.]
MPKITAPSVAEHRNQQREALIREATRILLSEGPAAVTPRAVGSAVGLARSSVYEYFPSSGELLAEVAIRAILEWSTELTSAIEPAAPGWPRLEAYVRSTLLMVKEGKHEIADRLEGVSFSDEQVERFMGHHDALSSPLPGIMAELGVHRPDLAGALAQGMVDAAVKRIAQGEDVEVVTDAVLDSLRHGFA